MDIKVQEKANALLNKGDSEAVEQLFAQQVTAKNNNVPGDAIIYFLNACLRKDAEFFNRSNFSTRNIHRDDQAQQIELNNHLATLGTSISIDPILPYLQHHKIGLELYNILETYNEGIASFNKFEKIHCDNSQAELNINILWKNPHFDVLLFENEVKRYTEQLVLDHSLSNEVQDALESASSEVCIPKSKENLTDEAFAKNLQIKEIKQFAKKYQDPKAFLQQLSHQLKIDIKHFAKSYETVESLAKELNKQIQKTGYSNSFFSKPINKKRDQIISFDGAPTSRGP